MKFQIGDLVEYKDYTHITLPTHTMFGYLILQDHKIGQSLMIYKNVPAIVLNAWPGEEIWVKPKDGLDAYLIYIQTAEACSI